MSPAVELLASRMMIRPIAEVSRIVWVRVLVGVQWRISTIPDVGFPQFTRPCASSCQGSKSERLSENHLALLPNTKSLYTHIIWLTWNNRTYAVFVKS